MARACPPRRNCRPRSPGWDAASTGGIGADPVLASAARRRSGQPLRPSAVHVAILGEVTDRLAIAVGRQWEAEAGVRRLNDPHPLPVCWDGMAAGLVEDLAFLAATVSSWPGDPPSDPAGWALQPSDLDGSDNELGDVLSRRVPTRRLVVLGEPGAGKTILLVRLILDLLARRSAGGPVPVLVSLASWNARVQDCHGWLAGRLTNDHPGLQDTAPLAMVNVTCM